ncbi:MAG: nucleotidyltransferase family protein [Byssovorax sp.]
MTAPSPLLRALRDPSVSLRTQSPSAHAEALLRGHVLAQVARALDVLGAPALLVKGAALALTVYPSPASRPMQDVDLLVRRADRDRILAALVAAGGVVHADPDRPLTGDFLGETAVMMPAGSTPFLVEIHTSLDNLVPRPIDEAGLFARAIPAPGLPGLLVLDLVDHTLLIALHAAGHELRHCVAMLDLELIFRGGVDLDALVHRASEWRLTTVMYAVMSALLALGAASITPAHVAAFDPGPIRRLLIERVHHPAAALDPPRPGGLGIPWILRQIPLRDDLAAYGLGLGKYAAARARERLGERHDSPAQRVTRAMRREPTTMAAPPRPGQDAAVSYQVPLWVKALLAVDRVTLRLDSLRDGVRDELLLAWIRQEDRAGLTAAVYAEQQTYFPGGHRFQSGLFPWERKAFDSPLFPRSGRVLIGAAGAGRELVALQERGFSVVAFDPCAPFADAARGVADPAKSTVIHASYADLVAAAEGRGGPLAAAIEGAPFDAVVLGWGSLSHVLPSSERTSLLRAVHTLAPNAPVLTSFAIEVDSSAPPESKGRVRDTLRRVFGALRAPGVSEAGDHFFLNGGFFAYLGSDEIVRLAWAAGYEVAHYEDTSYPHAILVPIGSPGGKSPRG